ncbi:DUF5685 family protein [Amycolatopsis sp. CA-128772]|uniref:DUF5685 family protein n=1 Tax=Amycolatopsis sp. CA-128772 TaxID=2073159 RepID=UPI000CD04CB7|nr:DUF5685 family protein [Amycolatopsis sp. CA-128772]
MFGIIRPCRHRLAAGLHADWQAHLCGLCLTLRDEHGQLARMVTNYDGLIISVLVEAQTPRADGRREAGPCPLRGMRTASVARGEGAQLAAAVSLVLAAAKVGDHVEDRDGPFGRRPVAAAARRVAARWAEQGSRTGGRVGFDTSVLTEAVQGQAALESSVRLGDSPLVATEPAERATAAAFARTAELAGRPGNAGPLAEAGRLFGRVAHLLDAVEDGASDAAVGAWNPLLATGTGLAEARRLCDDAVLGVELALRETEFAQPSLVHALLVHELRQAVRRAFGHGAACAAGHDPSPGHGSRPGVGSSSGRDLLPGDGSSAGQCSLPAEGSWQGARPGEPAGQQPPPGWIGPGPAPQQHPHQAPPGWIGPGPAPQQHPHQVPPGRSGSPRPQGFPPPGPVPPPGAPGPGGPHGPNGPGGPGGPNGPGGRGPGGPGGPNGPGGPGGPGGPDDPGGPGGPGGPKDPGGSRESGPYDGQGGGLWYPKFAVPPKKRNFFLGCALTPYMCCTCQFCCRDPYPGPWSGKPVATCDGCDCGGGCDGCCDCCSCCDCSC